MIAISSRFRLLAAIALWAALSFDCSPAHAAIGPDFDEPDRESLPFRRLTFPGRAFIQGFTFSADGQSLYVIGPNSAINLWEVGVYYWPVALGGVVLVGVFIVLLAMKRTARLRLVPGLPYCRRCNYCLLGNDSGVCPECGRPTCRPIIGKSLKRRLIPHTLFLVLLLGGYAALWAAKLPRQGWLSNYFHFWSRSTLVWAQNTGRTWLSDRAQNVNEIVEVDIASGEKTRSVFMRPIRQWSRDLVIESTPDGKHLLTLVGDDDALGLIEPLSGRVVRTLRFGDWDTSTASRWRQLAGFDDAGTKAFIVAADEPAKKTVLLEWDLRTGLSRELLRGRASLMTRGTGQQYLVVARFFRVPGERPLRFLEVPIKSAS